MRTRSAPRAFTVTGSIAIALGLAACGGGSSGDSATRTAQTPVPTVTASSPTGTAANASPSAATTTPLATLSATTAPQPTATSAPPTPVPTARPAATSATVNLDDQALQFAPATVTIAVGGTVTWVWGGKQFHDVTGDGFAIDAQDSGRLSHTFPAAGSYPYVCTIHESLGMRGTIVVQ